MGSSDRSGKYALDRDKPLQRTINSAVQLTIVVAWRHTVSSGSGRVSAVAPLNARPLGGERSGTALRGS